MMAISTELAINSLYMMFSGFLLIFIIIGISLFYSGLTQRRSAFTMLSLPYLISAMLFLDWYIWGYSLCYASSRNAFIGDLRFVVINHLKNSSEQVYNTQRGEILSILHFFFNGVMKLICAVLTFPACGAERGRIIPMLVFILMWSWIIYNPVNYWVWNRNGWLSSENTKFPVLDFAGGNCIHIVSGFTALAYSYYLGPRNTKLLQNYRSSNNNIVILGFIFILFGWSVFISGCDFNFGETSINLIVATFLCAFSAGFSWTALDFYFSTSPVGSEDVPESIELSILRNVRTGVASSPAPQKSYLQKRKLSMVSFSSGVMCGLVGFTPGGGYLCYSGNFWKSILCGVMGGIVGNLSTRIKYWLRVDDALDIFAVHGVCGIFGSLFVGVFAETSYDSKGGWVTHNWIQMPYQILGSVVTSVYVFFMSLFLLYLIDLIPGLHLRIDKHFNRKARAAIRDDSTDAGPGSRRSSMEAEIYETMELMGSDHYEFNGEYSMDFMEFIRVIDPNDFSQEDIEEELNRESYVSGSESTEIRNRKRAT